MNRKTFLLLEECFFCAVNLYDKIRNIRKESGENI